MRANHVSSKIFLTVANRLKSVWGHYLYLRADAEVRGRAPPSTAPSYPTPGKKFMIIRTELNLPQTGLFMGFDSIGKLPTETVAEEDSSPDTITDHSVSKLDGKRRWSLLGLNKMLSFKNDGAFPGNGDKGRPSLDDDFEQARRDLAVSRSRSGSGPPPPPKNFNSNGNSTAGQATSPGSDASSTGSSPIFEAQQFVFRFVLNWYPPAASPPVNRILSRPRLPAPAQSWVTARSLSGTQHPIVAGLPSITRRYSGSPQTGLINEARNANPLHTAEPDAAASRLSFSSSLSRALTEKADTQSRLSLSLSDHRPSIGERPSFSYPERPSLNLSFLDRTGASTPDSMFGSGTPIEQAYVQPLKPGGIYTKNAVYSGRSLAEWTIVVNECNNFIERRREEGVLGLSDVEVPTLVVEGFRRIS